MSGDQRVTFVISGMQNAGLCQKNKTTFQDAASEWNKAQVDAHDSTLLQVEISVNHYTKRKYNPEIRKKYLLLTEAAATWPKNNPHNYKHYDAVFAANSDSDIFRCVPWFNSPAVHTEDSGEFTPKGDEFTLIAADKLSLVKGELYSLRRRLLRKYPDVFIVYGQGWDKTFTRRLKIVLGEFVLALSGRSQITTAPIKSYLIDKINSAGPIETKFAAYKTSKYALVIENSMTIRTEKLYDAIESGVIPVYVGPRCHDDIDPRLYISSDPSEESVMEAVDTARAIDLHQWLAWRAEWMKSESYNKSSKERFFEFLNSLAIDFGHEN